MAKRRPLTSPAYLYRIERQLTPQARAAFRKAVAAWQRDVAAGREPNEKALEPFIGVTQKATKLAGTGAAEQTSRALNVALRFDLTNPAAVRWAKQNAARFIKDVAGETQAAVRKATTRALSGEMTVGQLGRYVRSIVGLTSGQEMAVWRFYERAIESGFADADALTEANGYAEQLRRYRSEVISRTEVLRAENAGQELVWEQGRDAGMLQGMVRVWIATADELACDVCGAMDGKTTPIGEPWEGPDGESFEIPQDSHPQCRCSAGLQEAR